MAADRHGVLNKQLIRNVTGEFHNRFGREPEWVAAAPGRVNLIGEHTDYNDGLVLPMAIERYTVMAAGRRDGRDKNVNACSINRDEPAQFAADDLRPNGTWADYIKGVLAEFIERGLQPQPLDLLVGSDVPMGCGLSSSAALQVATARLLQSMRPGSVDDGAIAALCQTAEQRFAGVPVGIMDPFCIANARRDHALFLDCRSLQARHIPFADPEVAVMIVDSKVSRQLRSGEYALRRSQCEAACTVLGIGRLRDASVESIEQARERLGDPGFRRARHVASEIARTREAAQAMREQDWQHFGELMYRSHESLQNDFEVSCKELDGLVETMREIGNRGGVFGARMTGGGFGGCMVSLVRRNEVRAISTRLASAYQARTGKALVSYVSTAAAGARVLQRQEVESP